MLLTRTSASSVGLQFASRAMRFPEEADLSKVNANMEAGVLRVTIPKREAAQTKRQTIKVA